MKFIPYSRQHIGPDDIQAVVNVLQSDFLTQGPVVERFEQAFARRVGAKYAVAVSSGTAALHVACLAAGITAGDEVIVPPITFAASANCVLYVGARPVFVDVHPATANIDSEAIAKKITRKTKAIIPVHYSGLPVDLLAIQKLARKHNLVVIDDACHALGAEYMANGTWTNIGAGRHTQMTTFSFHPLKHITTGEGGMVTTNNEGLYKKLLIFRSHGIYKLPQMARQVGPWYYEMRDLGFNYRLTDIQSALGLSQLGKLDVFTKSRRKIAAMYDQAFRDLDLRLRIPVTFKDKKHAYHLYALRLNFPKLRKNRQNFMQALKELGIMTQVHYIPVYRHPYYQKIGYRKGLCPIAEEFYEQQLSIPIFPGMTDGETQRVIEAVSKIIKNS